LRVWPPEGLVKVTEPWYIDRPDWASVIRALTMTVAGPDVVSTSAGATLTDTRVGAAVSAPPV
jgi:hypothetical protein